MLFSFDDLRELRRLLRDFKLVQHVSESKSKSKSTLGLLQVIDGRITIAISHSLSQTNRMGHLELDSESYMMLARALTKARPELFNKVRRAIFLQSQKEAFSGLEV